MVSTRTQQSARRKADEYEARGKRLDGHVAVVTGSDPGVGQAITIAFAEESADVAIPAHTDRQGAERAREEVGKAGARAFVDGGLTRNVGQGA